MLDSKIMTFTLQCTWWQKSFHWNLKSFVLRPGKSLYKTKFHTMHKILKHTQPPKNKELPHLPSLQETAFSEQTSYLHTFLCKVKLLTISVSVKNQDLFFFTLLFYHILIISIIHISLNMPNRNNDWLIQSVMLCSKFLFSHKSLLLGFSHFFYSFPHCHLHTVCTQSMCFWIMVWCHRTITDILTVSIWLQNKLIVTVQKPDWIVEF